LRYVKDPDTGKRVSRPNPESEWVVTDVPELRIIDQDIWDQVKAKQRELGDASEPFHKKQRPKNLFSFLLKCGECGGGFSMISQTHLGCSCARNKGTCENRLTIGRDKLEQAVLGALRNHLMDPQLCAAFCEEYTRHANRLRMEHNASLTANKRELDRTTQELDKLVDAIASGVPVERVKAKMWELENRRTELKAMIDTTQEAPTLLHPNMAHHYHVEIGRLIESLNSPDHKTEAAQIIRSLVDRIVLTPNSERKSLNVDLIGDLAGILAVATNRWSHNGGKPMELGGFQDFPAGQQDKMDAGAGFDRRYNRLTALI